MVNCLLRVIGPSLLEPWHTFVVFLVGIIGHHQLPSPKVNHHEPSLTMMLLWIYTIHLCSPILAIDEHSLAIRQSRLYALLLLAIKWPLTINGATNYELTINSLTIIVNHHKLTISHSLKHHGQPSIQPTNDHKSLAMARLFRGSRTPGPPCCQRGGWQTSGCNWDHGRHD